ncbi:DUF1835 domain-containing protein [Thiorhodococcus minor]|uniref:DUF1835 domain-containing protein n=1 Tax=Thiorhodococcus minor TaxID=57489 RepID=A0A6M0K580_9GAMM|nr:DUF1835 domain-containing protein [Thiorhodococcus minor]NEV64870.1 DUF1835 domain-containing protein [Thiorhodococcus minor]
MKNPASDRLHIALGDSAAGSLRAACRSHGLNGTVCRIPDDLSHGPLDDGRERMAYMRACYLGYDDWTFTAADAFAPWRALVEQLDQQRPEAIVVWSGDNVSESIFLRMACWHLSACAIPLLRVTVPERSMPPYVALHSPAELAELSKIRCELTASERDRLSEDFVRIRTETGLLRRLETGRIIGLPLEHYDALLLKSCATGWTNAARVVGAAMGRCDRHNLMSDLFFSSRLQILIGAGSLEADAVCERLRDYAVRPAPS